MRFIRFYILLIVLVLLSVGCVSDNAKNTSEKVVIPFDKAKTEIEDLAKDKTIIVYAKGMDETDATIKMVEKYNEQSDWVYVVYQELPSELNRRYEQILSGFELDTNENDIIEINNSWMAEFVDKGYIHDLGEYIKKDDSFDINSYIKNAVESSKYKDKIWGLPKNISTNVLFYRDDIVEKPPKTWDELIALASELKVSENIDYGYLMAGSLTEELALEATEFIYAYGGDVLKDGEILINSEESILGLNKMYQVYNADFMPKNIDVISETEALVSFMDGESVFMRSKTSNWVTGNQKGSLVADKFSVSPLPDGTLGKSMILASTIMLMSEKSENKDAVWDFMKFATGFEGQKINAIYASRFPTIVDVLKDKEVVENNYFFASEDFIEAITNARQINITPNYKEISSVMQQEIYEFLTSKQDAETTLSNIEKSLKILTN